MITNLTFIDFASLSPLIILLVGALILLLIESFAEEASRKISYYFALATLTAALISVFFAPQSQNTLLTHWLRFDALSLFFGAFFTLVGICSVLLSGASFKRLVSSEGEYYFLIVSSVFGLILIGAAADLLTIFLGLETLSISLYILCGYMKRWEISHEAAMKYFLMGSLAAAILLYGIALIYGAIGTTSLEGMLEKYKALSAVPERTLFLAGAALLTVGLAFKAAIVPFHVWAPDVYEGASTPVTAFMAVGTKAGAFAAFVRVFLVALSGFDLLWNEGIAILAYPTLIYANIVALKQTQMRRFFAYSGISHAGFLLIPLAAGGPDALPATLFYLVVYGIATLGCFAVLVFIDHRHEGVMLSDLKGLFKTNPLLAAILTLCLLTLAGIPPTIGFFAKFYIFKTAFYAGYYSLVVVALLTTILSAFYYLRIVAFMITDAKEKETEVLYSWPALAVGVASLAAILLLSIYPAPVLDLLASAF